MIEIRFYIVDASGSLTRSYIKKWNMAQGLETVADPFHAATFPFDVDGLHRANVFLALMQFLIKYPIQLDLRDAQ